MSSSPGSHLSGASNIARRTRTRLDLKDASLDQLESALPDDIDEAIAKLRPEWLETDELQELEANLAAANPNELVAAAAAAAAFSSSTDSLSAALLSDRGLPLQLPATLPSSLPSSIPRSKLSLINAKFRSPKQTSAQNWDAGRQ